MRYLGQRLIQFVLVFILVTFLVMVATRIGSRDPARISWAGPSATSRSNGSMTDYPYLDDPLPVQYVYWLKDVFTGDWGFCTSPASRTSRCSSSGCRPRCSSSSGPSSSAYHRRAPRRLRRVPKRQGVRSREQSRDVRRPFDTAARHRRARAVPHHEPAQLLPHARELEVRRTMGQPDRPLQELLRSGAGPRSRARRGVEPLAARRT